MDTLELTTEFGSLNFEDIEEFVTTKRPSFEGPSFEEPEFEAETEPELDENSFEQEMKKVIDIMKIAGNDLPVSTLKTIMTDLVAKAKEESETKAEEEEKIQVVNTLVNLFQETNAQRAQEAFVSRRPDVNPVRDQMEEISENIGKDLSQILIEKAKKRPQFVKEFKDVLELPTRGDEQELEFSKEDLGQILIEKAKQRPTVVDDFREILELPRRNKPRLHVKPSKEDFSQILVNKAKNKPDNFEGFAEAGLEAPRSPTQRPQVVTQVPSPTPETEGEDDFSQILIEKSKLKPDILKDFDSGLDLPDVEEYDEEEFPQFEEDFRNDPPATTIRPHVNLTDLLNIPKTKDMIEDHIMNMIIENPERAAADLAELFDIQNEKEKEKTEEELFSMMDEDPLAVTSAFTDLIMAQKNGKNTTSTEAAPVVTSPFEPVKIEDVPEAVRGQMERMKMKPQEDNQESIEDFDDNKEVAVEIGDQVKEVTVSNDLLNDMMKLIQDGQLSHREVIEELINNGVLPVEVTQIGKIPIIVGGKVTSEPIVTKSQPLRQVPRFQRPNKAREEVNLARLQQLKVMAPQMVMRDEHHILEEVGLNDPDSDFEMVKMPPRKKPETRPKSLQLALPIPDPTKTTEEKDIEILSSMMELFDQGLISDDELEQMVIMMEKEGVLDVDLEELGISPEAAQGDEHKPQKRPYDYGYGLNEDFRGEGPSIGSLPAPFYPKTARPYIENGDRAKSISYSHFSMQVPEGTPKPPELPPPSTESLHKAPFFTDLNMNNPFADPFEHEFRKTSLDFTPKPHMKPELEELKGRDIVNEPNEASMEEEFRKATMNFKPAQENVRPGPAPPYYLSARLPPPPHFKPVPTPEPPIVTEDFTKEELFKLKAGPEPFGFDVFDPPSATAGPREPFPPPPLKRHTHQSLPLILHSHEGYEHDHPHFDIPASLINPKAYMESLKKSPRHHSAQFLPRKGRLNYDVFQTTFKRKSSTAPIYEPPITGYSQVDRKMDQIRQSYINGDSIGANKY